MSKAKQWKTGGEEDKLLKKLIRSGKINKYSKPCTVQNLHPEMFGGFNDQVMRNHLNIVKRSQGLFCKSLNEMIVIEMLFTITIILFSSGRGR